MLARVLTDISTVFMGISTVLTKTYAKGLGWGSLALLSLALFPGEHVHCIDRSAQGLLEMRPFVNETGFDGGDDEWFEEYRQAPCYPNAAILLLAALFSAPLPDLSIL